ncbi:hypothetical protein B0A48_06274 [Cryoendolithus antarcticus]|uniref:Peptidase S54 rhomboid domain-containing protein n=1 Tax=Cryoendolithus antarcticus TaxID=1507870 RepID=A0A1V8TAV2_9PEZI|nr:hypothetical protein B0A48_06274 [Cryoendolithus antarcticus]
MAPRINLPPITRALLLILIALSTLNATLRFQKWSTSTSAADQAKPSTVSYLTSPRWAIPYLVLIPSKSIIYPWTFLTSALIENNIVSLAISGAVLWFGGRYLERAWGGREYTKFVLFVTMIPNIVTFFIYALWHSVRGYSPPSATPINGLLALSASFLVSLKQLVPEHTVSVARSMISIRLKHLPALFVLANMLSGPLLGTDTAFWLSLFGFYTGWIHLRFFRLADIGTAESASSAEGATMRGDPSETFAFVSFFPEIVHPFLAPVCNAVYDLLVQLKLIRPFPEFDVESVSASAATRSASGLPQTTSASGDGARTMEAERRRALALRALDERLNAAQPVATPSAVRLSDDSEPATKEAQA